MEFFLKINNRGVGMKGGWKMVLFTKTFENNNLRSLSNAMSSFLLFREKDDVETTYFHSLWSKR